MYKIGVEFNLYIENGRITDSQYANIINTGIGLKEFDWTASFIENYKKYLEPSVSKSAVNISWGYWYFYKQDFQTVLDYLNNVQYLPSYVFRMKSLRMRVYFELCDSNYTYFEILFADLNSFEQFIRRNNKLSNRLKMSYLNLIQLTRKLAKLKSNGISDKKEISKFESEFSTTEPIAVKSWLTKKLNEIKKETT